MSDNKPVNLISNPKIEDALEKAFTQGVVFMQVGNDGDIKVFDKYDIYKAPEGAKE